MKPNRQEKEFTLPDGTTVRERILALAGRGNKQFSRSLHPGVENVLGLRVPDLRRLAQEIARGDYAAYLDSHDTYYMEERMLHGMVLGFIPSANAKRYLSHVACFVPEINSWSVCDTFDFSGKGRFVAANSEEVRSFLLSYVDSPHEYEVRFAVVMLMAYFLGPDNWKDTVDIYERISHQGYYVKMAVAWALSVAFVRYPAQMESRLNESRFDVETLRMAVRKIRESRRVPPDAKAAASLILERRNKGMAQRAYDYRDFSLPVKNL